MTKRQIDLKCPFIAIRSDTEGDAYHPTMGEYFCNPLDVELSEVEISTGGFYTDADLGLIESNALHKGPYTIAAGGFVRFGCGSFDEYCQFVIHWIVQYRTPNGAIEKYGLGTFKELADCVEIPEIPCLGGPGRVVPAC